MIFVDRPDGRRVRGRTPFQAMMPYLMRGRNESAVYFSRDVEVESALAYVHEKNAGGGLPRHSLFGVVLAAALRTVAEKPSLNRFVHRRALYERRDIAFSFIVKKRLTEEALSSNAKIIFQPSDPIGETMRKVEEAIERSRGSEEGAGDREARLLHSIPGAKALVPSLFRLLDRFNVAPAWMIRNDPLYTTAFFANLGSLGLDTPFHHLYEWGTAGIFVATGRLFSKEVGRAEGGPALRRHLNIKVTVDERIADGIYFAHAAALFQRYIQRPELLELGPETRREE